MYVGWKLAGNTSCTVRPKSPCYKLRIRFSNVGWAQERSTVDFKSETKEWKRTKLDKSS